MEITTVWRKSAELIGTGYGYSTHGHFLAAGIKFSFGVWPVAPRHRAGVVWTYDRWQSVRWTEAEWRASLPNSFGGYDECWVADNHATMMAGSTCFYALWVEDGNGVKHWDNNQGWNYELIYPRGH